MGQQTFLLPWPISTNKIWRNVQAEGRARVKTTAAKKWQEHAGWLIREQRVQRVIGPVELRIELVAPHKTPFDISNYVKLLEDTLVSMGIIEDDNSGIVKRLIIELGQGFEGARVTVSEV